VQKPRKLLEAFRFIEGNHMTKQIKGGSASQVGRRAPTRARILLATVAALGASGALACDVAQGEAPNEGLGAVAAVDAEGGTTAQGAEARAAVDDASCDWQFTSIPCDASYGDASCWDHGEIDRAYPVLCPTPQAMCLYCGPSGLYY
jgi:hypothetical protein